MGRQPKPLNAMQIVELKLRDSLDWAEQNRCVVIIGEPREALDALNNVKNELHEARAARKKPAPVEPTRAVGT
jgi:hypothetical protein